LKADLDAALERERVLREALTYIADGKWLDSSDVLGTWLSSGDILSATWQELAVMEYARRALNPENGGGTS
jgi:hypothetical protein